MEGNDSFHNGVTINFIYYYGKLVYQNVNLRSYFRSPPTTKVSLGRCVILHFSKRTFIHSFFFFTLNIHLSFEIDLERYWGSKEVVRIGLVAMVDLVVVISLLVTGSLKMMKKEELLLCEREKSRGRWCCY
uniref:Transmembrane protein n=1 Tax=Populus trichocarpa TaxID=3694 RepID=A0A2K1XIR9_POPTR